jgi:glyoxylase-like metal-dependent hydrolase (beta-lactamase superfamily II)/rhodanese-related sulfurtransferase
MVPETTPLALARRLGTPDEPFLLDVRRPDEYAEWAIPGSVNIPLDDLPTRLDEVPGDREVVTVCATGRRSATAVELLAPAGRAAVSLRGGMAAWGVFSDTVTFDIGDARIIQIRRRGKGCLSYLVGGARTAVAVDPSLDVDFYQHLAGRHGWLLTDVFDTHLHADHVSGARRLAGRTGAALHLNPADPFAFEFEPLNDGEGFDLGGGAEMAADALHTPGHTEGSTVFAVGGRALITGDTLFIDGVGRPDLAGRAEEFARNLHRSLHERILPLDDGTLVLPAHHNDQVPVRPDRPVTASLGELRQTVAALSMSEEAFVASVAGRSTPRPPNQEAIVRVNQGHTDLPPDEMRRIELGPNRCAA